MEADRSETSPLDVVKAYQDAWTSGDFGSAERLLADDVTFLSPAQQLSSARDFLAMLTAFAQRIEHRWELVAATPEEDGVLILYRLFTGDGTPAMCADHFVVHDGRIQSETLVFDPQPFAAAAARREASG